MDRRKYYEAVTSLHIILYFQHGQNPSMIFMEVDKLSMCGNMKE